MPSVWAVTTWSLGTSEREMDVWALWRRAWGSLWTGDLPFLRLRSCIALSVRFSHSQRFEPLWRAISRYSWILATVNALTSQSDPTAFNSETISNIQGDPSFPFSTMHTSQRCFIRESVYNPRKQEYSIKTISEERFKNETGRKFKNNSQGYTQQYSLLLFLSPIISKIIWMFMKKFPYVCVQHPSISLSSFLQSGVLNIKVLHTAWRSACNFLMCLFSRKKICVLSGDWTQHFKHLRREKIVPKYFPYLKWETQKTFKILHISLPFCIFSKTR